jgi:hypothetical protein
MTVTHSLVSGNISTCCGGDSGGIQNFGPNPVTNTPGTLEVDNSTIAGNTAALGGGIFSWCGGTNGACSSNGTKNATTIVNSTIAYNDGGTRSTTGGGLLESSGAMSVRNSIVAFNTVDTPSAGTASNCGASSPGTLSSLGYNLETGTDCVFTSTGDLQSGNPGFASAALQNNGGNTDTLGLAAGSVAIDHVPTSASGCGGTDQRDVARPQGSGCDIGAYELSQTGGPQLTPGAPKVISTTSAAFTVNVNPEGLATSVVFEYGPQLPNTPFSYTSTTAAQPIGPDFSNHTVTVTVSGLLPHTFYHAHAIATNSAGTTTGTDQTLTTPADPAPRPPVLGKTVNASVVSGLVLVKLPGNKHLYASDAGAHIAASLGKGVGFVPLTEARSLPAGTQVDARLGAIALKTAASTRHGKLGTGTFNGGLFKLSQDRRGLNKGLTTLSLLEGAFPGAPTYASCKVKKAADSSPFAFAALSSAVLQSMKSKVHGKFGTRGRYGGAVARSTAWTTIDRCDGTLVTVQRDVVSVQDFVRHVTVVVRAGHRYLARAPTKGHKRK